MNGLEAIAAHNGWSIAAVGISIVFTGLVILSLTISQLHKVLAFWDDRDMFYMRLKDKRDRKVKAADPVPPIILPEDIQETAHNFKLLVNHIGDPFPLPKLLDFAVKCGIDRPHSKLNRLLKEEVILPGTDGFYSWNQKVSH